MLRLAVLACLLRLIAGAQIKGVHSLCTRLDGDGLVRGVGTKQYVALPV